MIDDEKYTTLLAHAEHLACVLDIINVYPEDRRLATKTVEDYYAWSKENT